MGNILRKLCNKENEKTIDLLVEDIIETVIETVENLVEITKLVYLIFEFLILFDLLIHSYNF